MTKQSDSAKPDSLGEFEQCLLVAVVHLGQEAYGVTIRQEIERRTNREVAIGALYTSLDRLERKGYLRSAMSDPTPQRGGRSKRYFALTARGGAGSASREIGWHGCGPGSHRIFEKARS